MKLKLIRNRFAESWTTGQLYIDDVYFCFTLEDVVRPVGAPKVMHETAIPYGEYLVTLENSPRFGPNTITINDVPGFTGIRIHSGNTNQDTSGCIIVGYRITNSGVIVPGTTRTALAVLKRHIQSATDKVVLTIV